MAIDSKDLRKAQLIMLDMLKEFDAICQKYNLKYWLDSGTALGAKRHKGFIPWDDDIDISMPIEDYYKFLEVAEDELSQDIFLQTKARDCDFKFDYAKLRSNKAFIVEFHEKDREVKYHQGVFVDIFPMITLPNTDFYKKFYNDIFALIRDVSAVSLHTPNGKDLPEVREGLIESFNSLHCGWSDKDLIVAYGGQMPDLAAWFEIEKIFPLTKTEFEGLEFYVPKSIDHYLSQIYSFDYMQLPPEDKRQIHAHEIWFK